MESFNPLSRNNSCQKRHRPIANGVGGSRGDSVRTGSMRMANSMLLLLDELGRPVISVMIILSYNFKLEIALWLPAVSSWVIDQMSTTFQISLLSPVLLSLRFTVKNLKRLGLDGWKSSVNTASFCVVGNFHIQLGWVSVPGLNIFRIVGFGLFI